MKLRAGRGLRIIFCTSEDEANLNQLTKDLHTRLDEILVDFAVKFTYAWLVDKTVPATINNQAFEEAMCTVLRQALGEENLLLFKSPFPFASEDFAHYLLHVPGVFLLARCSKSNKRFCGCTPYPRILRRRRLNYRRRQCHVEDVIGIFR